MVHSDRMPSVEPSPRESVGSLLRNARLSHGLDIAQVADALRIRLSFIEAIEEGRHQDLPGPTYAVGFVRAYADYMGLDGNEIIRRYKEETSIVPRKAELEFPTPVSEGGLPTGAMILIAILLGAGVYGGWYWMSNEDRSVAQLIQDVPERFNSLLTASPDAEPVVEAAAPSDTAVTPVEPVTPAAEAAPEPAPVVPAAPEQAATAEPAPEPEADVPPTVEEAAVPPAEEEEDASVPPAEEEEPAEVAAPTPTAEQPAAPVEQARAEPAPAPAPAAPVTPNPAPAAEAPAAPAPQPERQVAAIPAAPELPEQPVQSGGTVYGAPAGSTRVVLAAKEDTWIQVRAGEELIATRLLRRGERFQVPERTDLTLMVGNAGGLQIQVDGKPLPALGGKGEVRRGIRLDPERLATN